jgi:release factor glutamine methyltransferase
MTLREALATGFSQFHAVPRLRGEALLDAAYLLRHAIGISHASLLANYDRVLTPAEQATYQDMVSRRLTNEPVRYITGECEFYGLPLRVNPAVLIPRNSTEHLVEAALEELRERDQAGQELRIVDVGTGSGAIAIALAHHLPHAQVIALDLSTEALEVAASNAGLNAVAERIRFLESDLLDAVSGEPRFDAVVSNPPYIATVDRDLLHPQIRDFEPEVSLYGGPAGLDIYRRLIPQAHAALKPNGLFAIEISHRKREAITELLAGWNSIRFVDDLQQIPRVAVARKPESSVSV